jgi:hypothetical protein
MLLPDLDSSTTWISLELLDLFLEGGLSMEVFVKLRKSLDETCIPAFAGSEAELWECVGDENEPFRGRLGVDCVGCACWLE